MPLVRAPDRSSSVGRTAGSARTMADAARGRGARFAPAHGVARPVRARVAQVLQPYLDQGRIPGISVAIVTDGQVALTQGYGVSNVKTHAPVEANTRFDIGSVTKTFTAIGVLLLYQQSQGTSDPLDLNAPISEYLKNTRSFKLPRKWAGVTTTELLNMTSGIGNASDTQPWQAQVASVGKHPLLFAPGTKTFYSDTGFDLLGELIEQRTGEKYGTFVQNQILAPLGMSETQELGQSPTVSNQAVGYNARSHGSWPRAKIQNGPELYAAAGMVSTAQDMATYMTALLSKQILDPATYNLMWTSTPTPEYGVNPPPNTVRGLGWDTAIDTSAGPTMVAKGGSIPGFVSEIILYPNSDSGVFVSINTNPSGSRGASPLSALQVAESVYAATQD